MSTNFNPRSLAGATGKIPAICNVTLRDFNPRSLAGATVAANDLAVMCKFQSTLPRGSDQASTRHSFSAVLISIHAPSRERLSFKRLLNCLKNFNPRSLAGATYTAVAESSISQDFNPRSLAGATNAARIVDNYIKDFNPRSLAGATTSIQS